MEFNFGNCLKDCYCVVLPVKIPLDLPGVNSTTDLYLAMLHYLTETPLSVPILYHTSGNEIAITRQNKLLSTISTRLFIFYWELSHTQHETSKYFD
eukprot:GAHX01003857.1.p1 GENE.GAHX01003857.1~~GAHX01003857.1.p1  ORF type:complete len:96 (-),score=4.83 GAHX01003857.1:53-340(-)